MKENELKHQKELAKDLAPIMSSYGQYWRTELLASDLIKLGYRKQSVGEWLEIDDGVSIGDGKHLECSKCGVWKKDKQRSNFCPNCGAKMKGGAE